MSISYVRVAWAYFAAFLMLSVVAIVTVGYMALTGQYDKAGAGLWVLSLAAVMVWYWAKRIPQIRARSQGGQQG